MEQQVGHVYIPEHVMEMTGLSLVEKVLYGKIVGLTQKEGYCFASNDWLGRQLGKSSDTISGYISKLVKLKLIKREVSRNEKKQIINRKLYAFQKTSPIPIGENAYTPIGEFAVGIQENISKSKKENIKEKVRISPSLLPAGEPSSDEPLTSKNSLTPCTPLEIWEMAMKMDVPIRHVREKHEEIIEMIKSGEFMKRYKFHKTVYHTLKKWLKMSLERGYIDYCNEIEAIENPNEHPDKVAWVQEALKVADEMRKRGEL